MTARSDEEYVKFCKMDQDRYHEDECSYPQNFEMHGSGYRLLTLEEVPKWLTLTEEEIEEQEDNKARSCKKSVNYAEIDSDGDRDLEETNGTTPLVEGTGTKITIYT
eukprot:CAMPEP_0201282500 /NCGR_PEP_ID=MMETSP1317-20130820/5795_1 /ASSEMBLY_ACC=CAM_ASM_000770 /TAXON_ID=187299 /ORGANISM="Undescribed Undescribed, Strain Undescribed" /LENGTH=106 /DNA_ID=CAMNT_0047595331 /DNA_START=245 /DNA_END=561 /DNA_ORIENTATION=-